MDEHRLPAVHITQIVEEGGRRLEEPLTSPVCDFCAHDSPAWDYDCHDFVTERMGSTGQWAACTPCSDMIEADDWGGVMERCLLGARKLGLDPERWRPHAEAMHRGFRENRYGERQPWG